MREHSRWSAVCRHVRIGGALALVVMASIVEARTTHAVEIRRTTDGIPHLRAGNWRELGLGVGYVQAQDALCTLAEAFVTYRGRRAWFFGADARPARGSTFGRPTNLDLDFFFRGFADETVIAHYREQQPFELSELIEGFAAGYNRYLADVRSGQAVGRPCVKQPWVHEISADDIYRRMYSAQIAAGYANFIPEIVNAKPAVAQTTATQDVVTLHERLTQHVGGHAGLGSNVLAFGRQATGGEDAVLFGNPHWYWGGPDRFYQMHLTIPGRLDVAGVAFLGIPLIMIGFNDHVAWSHTVSAARRFGLFDLTLDASDPTSYQLDGKSEAMRTQEVSVAVRAADGGTRNVTRTLYRTRFGPAVDLGGRDAAFGWGRTHALAIRDVNAENFRIFRTFYYWNQAKSLDEFIEIQRREAAMPWVNTVAIGRGDGRVWYGDIGAVPNVTDELRDACSTSLAKRFAHADPTTPVLDGSRSGCDWQTDAAAKQPGAMPVSAQPWLLRHDYVANMNDSYWLTNVHQPLEGFPSVLGGERQPLELRGRLGHRMALDLLHGAQPPAEASSRRLMHAVLTPRAYSAELYKNELLASACSTPTVEIKPEHVAGNGEASGTDLQRVRTVDLSKACQILQRWPNTANPGDRGALLWEAFWSQLMRIPGDAFYGVAFSPAAPLDTPRAPNADRATVAQALAAAVVALNAKGLVLDAPLRSQRFVESGGRRWPIYGGCHSVGYFTVVCSTNNSERLGPDAVANSYLQVVHFGPKGVEAYTLLAHGLDEAAVSNGGGTSPVARYARKDWLDFPFRESEIARDPQLRRTVLR